MTLKKCCLNNKIIIIIFLIKIKKFMNKCPICEEEISEKKEIKCSLCLTIHCSVSCLLEHYSIHQNIKSDDNSPKLLLTLKRRQSEILTEKYNFLSQGNYLENNKYDDIYKIENFELIKKGFFPLELGHGSFGRVYLGKNKINNKLCAIKTINKRQIYRIYGNYKIIYNEISIHSRCIHQNIIRLYNIYEDENEIKLILEYAPNGTLYEKIKEEKKLDEKKAYSYFIQILNAVTFLHLNNIIHRDIKPENILIDENEMLKLCDFGWSKEIDLEKRHSICGTVEYMAPEIIQRENYDFGVDIWSLGIFLYEMVIGHSPFYAKEIKNIKIKIKEHNIEFDDNISYNCRDLIKKLLNSNPEKRFKLKDICKHPFIIENIKKIKNDNLKNKICYKKEKSKFVFGKGRSCSSNNLISVENKRLETLKSDLNLEIEKTKKQIKQLDFQQQNFDIFENIKNKRYMKKKLKKSKCIVPIYQSKTIPNNNENEIKNKLCTLNKNENIELQNENINRINILSYSLKPGRINATSKFYMKNYNNNSFNKH